MNEEPRKASTGARRSGRAVRASVALAAALALAAGACSSEAQTTDATSGSTDRVENQLAAATDPVDGGVIAVGVPAETDGWNPHRNRWASWGSLVGSAFLEPIATVDGDGGAVPWLAESIEPNATYDEWTISIRDGVTFHNGEVLDADVVKLNLDDALSSAQTRLVYGPLFDEIAVTGERTLVVKLTQPWAVFPISFLASQAGLMMAPEMLSAEDGGQKSPIGTGPFVFQEWSQNDKLVGTKNKSYWRSGEPHLDEVEFRVLPDPLTQTNAMRAGDVDLVFTRFSEAVANTEPDWQLVKNWGNEPTLVIPNTLPEIDGVPNPMANVHARLALAYATDRQALAEDFGEGAIVPTSPFAPETPWGEPVDVNGYPDFDVDKAKEEVQRYKDDTGDDGLSITLTGPSAGVTQIMQVLQSQWQEAGIEVALESVETTALIPQVVGGTVQLALFNPYSAPDPDQDYHFWSSSTATGPGTISINFSQFKSAAVDEGLHEGRVNADPTVRKQAYADVIKELNANATNIWLFWTPNTAIANPRVGGLQALADVTWANTSPKVWWGQLWVTP